MAEFSRVKQDVKNNNQTLERTAESILKTSKWDYKYFKQT